MNLLTCMWQTLQVLSEQPNTVCALRRSRGTFSSSASLLGGGDHPPDTFLATPGFSKVGWCSGRGHEGCVPCFAARKQPMQKPLLTAQHPALQCTQQHEVCIHTVAAALYAAHRGADALLVCYRVSPSSMASIWGGTGQTWGPSKLFTCLVCRLTAHDAL